MSINTVCLIRADPQVRMYVYDNSELVSQTFILADRQITFTGRRDRSNPGYFFLDEASLSTNGGKEFQTHYIYYKQINQLFAQLDRGTFTYNIIA